MKSWLYIALLLVGLQGWGQSKDSMVVDNTAYNQELNKEIQSMLDFDQELRKIWGELEEKYGKESEQVDSIKQVVDDYRQKHTDRLMEIYETDGFPDHNDIGKGGIYNVWVMALHSLDVEFQKLTLIYMTTEAQQGALEWERVAMLTDRIRYHEDKPQYYGTRFKVVSWEKKTVELYPVIDVTHLDQRRKAIGLVPVKEMYASWGYTLINAPEQK